MHFSHLVVAALSAPLCVDGTPKDGTEEDTNVASLGGIHFGDGDNLAMPSMPILDVSPLWADEGGLAPVGLDNWKGKVPWEQATELRNPEFESENSSGDEETDDFAVDTGVLAEDCVSYPVVNETGQLNSTNFGGLVYLCYSDSPYLEYCPDGYNVGLHCWNTSFVTDLSLAFLMRTYFNDDISSWDTGSVTTMRATFAYAPYFNSDVSSWDTGKVTTLDSTFFRASRFNSDVSSWDTGSVTTLRATFAFASSFNQDISSWDTGNVTTLLGTFGYASSFNQDISSWVTGKVTSLLQTFRSASSFNSDISSWDTGNVTTLGGTFAFAPYFNSDVSSWDTGKVTTLLGTFALASSFNSDISSWDTGNVTEMVSMFYNATEFNQCLGSWAANSPSNVKTTAMLYGTACPNQSDPDPEKGPWCQGFEDRCFGACVDAEEFRFGKREKRTCDSINDITAPTQKWLKKKIRKVCKKIAFPNEEATGKKIRVRDICQEACGSRGFGPGKRCENFSL